MRPQVLKADMAAGKIEGAELQISRRGKEEVWRKKQRQFANFRFGALALNAFSFRLPVRFYTGAEAIE